MIAFNLRLGVVEGARHAGVLFDKIELRGISFYHLRPPPGGIHQAERKLMYKIDWKIWSGSTLLAGVVFISFAASEKPTRLALVEQPHIEISIETTPILSLDFSSPAASGTLSDPRRSGWSLQ